MGTDRGPGTRKSPEQRGRRIEEGDTRGRESDHLDIFTDREGVRE